MAITLGNYTFDEARTSVIERYEEVGGQDARVIQIKGVIEGLATLDLVEAALDSILDAASDQEEETPLVLRSGRRLYVCRTKFSREVLRDGLVGSFVLTLEAQNPFEESLTETLVSWNITSSGQTKTLTTSGNVFALPKITLVASGNVVNPAFTDGTRQITYLGTVANGKTLVFDAMEGKVTLESEIVTPYASGLFPRIAPGGATLTYTDHASSSHAASVTAAYRDRWW